MNNFKVKCEKFQSEKFEIECLSKMMKTFLQFPKEYNRREILYYKIWLQLILKNARIKLLKIW